MDAERHDRARRILEEALRLADAAARDRFIAAACASDASLQAECKSLLPHFIALRGFEPPPGAWGGPGTTTLSAIQREAESQESGDPSPPFYLDQYEVLDIVGRGGMGVVYRARQIGAGRIVAIKLLRDGLVSRQDRWRFAFETEVLRMLNHPGIARMICANTTGPRPYLVMEHVEGAPLTRFAAEHGLSPHQRLMLLAAVCHAVEFAHQRGIVHRDLKPSNILVDTRGAPRVVDFGIAHVLAMHSTVLAEESGRFIGTRNYASPEQAAGLLDRISPDADVYALGITAHELLAGDRPSCAGGIPKLRLENLLCEDQRTRSEFRFFVERIIRTALRLTPNKRYPTAGAFGADIERLLSRFPDPAARPTLGSRALDALRRAHHFFTNGNDGGSSKWTPTPLASPVQAVFRKRMAHAMLKMAR